MAKSWYAISNKDSEDGKAEVFIYDEIGGWGVWASEFIKEIKQLGDFDLRINSPGGDVFEGYAIANAIKSHKGNVTVKVEGMAASIASIVALAGDKLEMSENAFFMIHNAWTFVVGNAKELRKAADDMEKISQPLVSTYVKAFNVEESEVIRMMDEETWLGVEDMQELGVKVSVTESLKVAAKANKINIPTKVLNIITMENNEENKDGLFDRFMNKLGDVKQLKAELATKVEEATTQTAELADVKASLEESEAKTVAAEAEVTTVKASEHATDEELSTVQASLEAVIAELEALKAEAADEETVVDGDGDGVQAIAKKAAPVVAKRSLKNIMAKHAEKKRLLINKK